MNYINNYCPTNSMDCLVEEKELIIWDLRLEIDELKNSVDEENLPIAMQANKNIEEDLKMLYNTMANIKNLEGSIKKTGTDKPIPDDQEHR